MNVVGLITPFIVSVRGVADSLGTIKENIDKNRTNIRLIAYAQEKLEQYTCQKQLTLIYLNIVGGLKLRAKCIDLAQIVGVTVQESVIKDIENLAIILVPLIMILSRGHTGQIKG